MTPSIQHPKAGPTIALPSSNISHSANLEPASQPVDAIETNSLASKIRSLVNQSDALNKVIYGLGEIISAETECLAIWFAESSPESESFNIHPITDENATAVQQVAGEKLSLLIQSSCQREDVCSIGINASHSLIAAPIVGGENQLAIAGCFLETNQSSLRQQWMMTLAAQAIEQWLQRKEHSRTAMHAKSIGEALGLCGSLDRSASNQEAASLLVNHLRRILNAAQVVFCEGSRPENARLVAISEVEQFDANSESSKTIRAAVAEGIGVAEPIVLTPTSRPDPAIAIPLEAYCKANKITSCAAISVSDQAGEPTGAIMVAIENESFTEAQLAQLQQFATVNGTHLDVVRRANFGFFEMVGQRLRSVPRKKWFRVTMLAAAVGFAILCVPAPYRVACDCEIQPAVRRFVAAPYTGPLEKTLVRPGEVVTAGQVLARMDGQQLRHELTGVEAEYQGAKRRRDSSLAQGEVAQSQIARSEMNRLESRINSLQDQLSRLEVRSPYDGIVISGDLEKAEGAAMEIGQTLFEIAPLDNMLAEVAIPESEIQYVNDSHTVAIKLNAFPFQTFTGDIRTIYPSAEVLNDDSVFIADVDMSNAGVAIRPGMKGSAKIKTSWRPLGWNLFHNAWESVRCWTIW